ncbi:hypothetical protein V498_00177 [Pseudogymnoascus sp. VKM F-4517 (FW-2822)]|nr:hypothetical protein V498_00177 [Pseudogymnoascus sp. VKM F-4517 (FW-2822)]
MERHGRQGAEISHPKSPGSPIPISAICDDILATAENRKRRVARLLESKRVPLGTARSISPEIDAAYTSKTIFGRLDSTRCYQPGYIRLETVRLADADGCPGRSGEAEYDLAMGMDLRVQDAFDEARDSRRAEEESGSETDEYEGDVQGRRGVCCRRWSPHGKLVRWSWVCLLLSAMDITPDELQDLVAGNDALSIRLRNAIEKFTDEVAP